MGEELFEIVAHEVTVEVKDENTGEVFRRELPISSTVTKRGGMGCGTDPCTLTPSSAAPR